MLAMQAIIILLEGVSFATNRSAAYISVSEWGVNHRNLVLSIKSSEASQFNSVVI